MAFIFLTYNKSIHIGRPLFALFAAANLLIGVQNPLAAQNVTTPDRPSIQWVDDVFEESASSSQAAETQEVDVTKVEDTKPSSGVVRLYLADFNTNVAARDTSREGAWEGVRGSTQPPVRFSNMDSTENLWTRVTVPPYGTVAASRKFVLPEDVTEVWWAYDIQFGSTWTPIVGVKLPGIAAAINSNFSGQAGGTGGGWAGLCRSFSNRGSIQPNDGGAYAGRLGYETYNLDSDNFGRVDGAKNVWGGLSGASKDSAVEGHILDKHPCLEPSNNPPTVKINQQFGESNKANATHGSITDNLWHSVVHRLKLNTLPKATSMNDYWNAPRDGEVQMWLDGEEVFFDDNLNFTNNPQYHRLSLFLQVYHGGSADTTGTEHDVFFANFRYTTNPKIGENL